MSAPFCIHRLSMFLSIKSVLDMWCAIQATFWRCSKSELTPVPVAGLHSNSRGDFVEPTLKCTAVAGLRNGFTLVATNHATMCVIDRLRVIKKYSDLDGVINEIAPLEGRSFVAVVQERQRVDLYVNELDHEEVAGLTLHLAHFIMGCPSNGLGSRAFVHVCSPAGNFHACVHNVEVHTFHVEMFECCA
jgi:hypothetical protein